MNIKAAASYLKAGYRVRRASWASKAYVSPMGNWFGHHFLVPGANYYNDCGYQPRIDDLLADDWEIITDGIVKDFPITYQE